MRRRIEIAAAARDIVIVMRPNMSVGVNVTLAADIRARAVDRLRHIEVIEAHHRHKVDAPSGTVSQDGRGRQCLGRDLKDRAVYARARASPASAILRHRFRPPSSAVAISSAITPCLRARAASDHPQVGGCQATYAQVCGSLRAVRFLPTSRMVFLRRYV